MSKMWKIIFQQICNHFNECNLCQFCVGKEVVTGVNDLATVRPDILSNWDYKENDKRGIYPNRASAVSRKVAKLICKKCGNPFDKRIRYLVECTCKKCTSRKLVTGVNDLSTLGPICFYFP